MEADPNFVLPNSKHLRYSSFSLPRDVPHMKPKTKKQADKS